MLIGIEEHFPKKMIMSPLRRCVLSSQASSRHFFTLAKHEKRGRALIPKFTVNANGGGQTYDLFVQWYSGTIHDDITFDSVDPQSDGSVNVNITIHATEQGQTETFSASYVLENVDGNWNIVSGFAQKV